MLGIVAAILRPESGWAEVFGDRSSGFENGFGNRRPAADATRSPL
ncbi:MAG: hypothetical protein ACAF42_16915 [Limnothrix sp. BL-A-16]